MVLRRLAEEDTIVAVEQPTGLRELTGEEGFEFQKGFFERAREGLQAFGEAVVGQTEFDLPEAGSAFRQLGLDRSLSKDERNRFGKVGLQLSLAREDAGAIDIIKNSFPNARVFDDRFGNNFVLIGDRSFAVNVAGLSTQDIEPLIAEAGVLGVTSIPAARAGRAIAGVTGQLFGAGAGLFGGSVARDIAEQAAGSQQPVDLERATEIALIGLGFESAVLTLGALSGPARNAVRNIFSQEGTVVGGQLTPRANRALTEAGINPQDLSPEVIEGFEQAFRPGTDVAAQIRQLQGQALPVPVSLTGGQAARDPALLAIESEARKGAFGPEAQAATLGTQEVQQAALRENIPAMQREFFGEVRAPGEAGVLTQNALVQTREASRRAINTAFTDARTGQAAFTPEGVANLNSSLRVAVEDFDLGALPRASRLFDDFEELTVAADGANAVQLNNLERWRRRAVNARRGAGTPEEREAVRRLISQYDDFLENSLKEALVEGDEAAIAAWRTARGLRARFGQIFEQDDIVNTLTATMRDGSRRLIVQPDDVVDYVFGRASLGAKRGLSRDLKKLQDVLGKDSQAWQEVRQEGFLRFFRRDRGDVFPAETFRQELFKALREAPESMRILFSQSEVRAMRELSEVAQNIAKNPTLVGDINRSGTAIGNQVRRLVNSFGPLGRGARAGIETLLRGPRQQLRATQAIDLTRGIVRQPAPQLLPPGVAGTAGGVIAGP